MPTNIHLLGRHDSFSVVYKCKFCIVMKQHLNSDQTAKLIELGFEMPKSIERVIYTEQYGCGYEAAYSIGELIEILPENIAKENEMPSTLNISLLDGEWCVEYADFLGADFSFRSVELIDAIFDMIEKLKEEGVI